MTVVMGVMRAEACVTTISWIPSEAIPGATRFPFEVGITHYDPPPPPVLDDLEALRAGDSFRFANELRAYIEVRDDRIAGFGHLGGGHMGATTIRLGSQAVSFAAACFPELRPEPEVSQTSVRFVQTVGGHTALPAPRRVDHRPFLKLEAPSVWTTLALTIHADGSSTHELVGASPFPRHWIYDRRGTLCAKSGLTDFRSWYRTAFGRYTPWGDKDSPALVTTVEGALERQLSQSIMSGGTRPQIRSLKPGTTLVEQGQPGSEVYLLLDGVLTVEVDGRALAELGPGVVVGERALLEGGRRSSTLRALTACRLAVVPGNCIAPAELARLSDLHRREEA